MDLLFFVSIGLIMMLAGFVQGASGFGSSLVAMPLTISLIGLADSRPTIATISLFIGLIIFPTYYKSLRFGQLKTLLISVILGIPLGSLLLYLVPQSVAMMGLGGVIVFYCLFRLLNFPTPSFQRPAWGIGMGVLSGMLGGAYNTGGPPLVIYGDAVKWDAAEFKVNLQTIFFVTNIFVNLTHIMQGNHNTVTLRCVAVGIPAIIVGTWLGTKMDRWINPERFQKIVLAMLFLVGLRMIFS